MKPEPSAWRRAARDTQCCGGVARSGATRGALRAREPVPKPRESEAAPLTASRRRPTGIDDGRDVDGGRVRGPGRLRFGRHEALVELRSLAQPEPFGQVWTVHEERGRGAFAIVRRARNESCGAAPLARATARAPRR